MPSRPDAPARRVGAALAERGTRGMSRAELWKGLDQGSMMGMEFVAAILTWTGIGWLLDRWLGTAPWLLVVGAIVGNTAGLYLIWLRSRAMDEAPAPRLGSGSSSAARTDRSGEEGRRLEA